MREILFIIMLVLWLPAVANGDMGGSNLSGDSLMTDSAQQVHLEPHDSIIVTQSDTIRDKNYWFKELKHGKIHLDDKSVYYPSVISWTWNTIKKINHILNDFDTTYVKGTGKVFKVTLKNNNWFDDYDYRVEDLTLLFHSKITCNLGAQLSVLGISGGYEVSTERLKKRGNKSKKFELSFTCGRFAIEYYRMNNWGDMTLSFIDKDGDRFSLEDFTGIKRKTWGVNAYYFLNNRRYSQAAAYGFSKRQLRNAGSLLVGASVSHCNFTVLNYYLPEYFWDEEDDFDEDDEETIFDYTDVSLDVGYGYNWAISHRLLLNVTGLIYTGLKYSHRKASSDGGKTYWAFNGKVRLGFIYNYGRFFGGLHAYVDSHLFNTGPYRFSHNLYDFSLIAGIQF